MSFELSDPDEQSGRSDDLNFLGMFEIQEMVRRGTPLVPQTRLAAVEDSPSPPFNRRELWLLLCVFLAALASAGVLVWAATSWSGPGPAGVPETTPPTPSPTAAPAATPPGVPNAGSRPQIGVPTSRAA